MKIVLEGEDLNKVAAFRRKLAGDASSGLYFEISADGENGEIAATNGYALAVREITADNKEIEEGREFKKIVLLGKTKFKKGTTFVEFGTAAATFTHASSGTAVILPYYTAGGNFPNYKPVIPALDAPRTQIYRAFDPQSLADLRAISDGIYDQRPQVDKDRECAPCCWRWKAWTVVLLDRRI